MFETYDVSRLSTNVNHKEHVNKGIRGYFLLIVCIYCTRYILDKYIRRKVTDF